MTNPETIQWCPVPSSLPPALRQAYRHHSLPREISQANLLFYAFALFAVSNLAIDLVTDNTFTAAINALFVFVSLAAAAFTRRVLDERILHRIVSLVALLVVGTLIAAKTQLPADDWFVYFADLLLIIGLCLMIPISFPEKLLYPALIITADIIVVSQGAYPPAVSGGIILFLAAATVFSLIIYISMERAHFSAFQAMRREQQISEALRNARESVGELQTLLPVCASCKKVRDDDGYWEQIDAYLNTHLDINVSHGICPECSARLFPE